jgi:hypothetical protein
MDKMRVVPWQSVRDGSVSWKAVKCRRCHVWDGTSYAGQPEGPELAIIKLEDHFLEMQCRATLFDGKWEFLWNLHLFLWAPKTAWEQL